jgi:spore coat protein H
MRFVLASLPLAIVWLAQLPLPAASYQPSANKHGDDIFDRGHVPRLEIIIPPESLKTLRAYRQVWRQKRPERIDVPVTVREGDRSYTNVAVHLKGSYSFQSIDEKPSLTLNFDKFAPGQRFHGLKKIHLNNSVQDPTYLCEKLARELFNEHGVPAARAGHAMVRINGRDAEPYVLVEAYDRQFVKRHFDSDDGNLYDGGSGGDITKALEADSGTSPENRTDLTNLVRAARERSPGARQAQLARVLDVERFRTFAALEILLVHWDGYCAGAPNNYRVFHDTESGRMIFMPHGLDQLFGVSSSVDFSITPPFKGLVAKGLFGVPEERQRLRQRMAELLKGECSTEKLHARVDRIAEPLRKAFGNSIQARFEFEWAVNGLKERIAARNRSVARQLAQPEKTFPFASDGTARLVGWTFKGAGDAPALGSRNVENGREFLNVRARGSLHGSGAWRKTVLLEQGHYELSGLGRTQGIERGATNTGVMLRISGERSAKGLSASEVWTPLRYEFDVHGVTGVELICEFRGVEGSGSFDVSSLKLRRIGPPRALPAKAPEAADAE